jgi:hypothetical protein
MCTMPQQCVMLPYFFGCRVCDGREDQRSAGQLFGVREQCADVRIRIMQTHVGPHELLIILCKR